MIRIALLCMISCQACGGWLRTGRVCNMVVDGACLSMGESRLSGESISEAIDIAYHRYALKFGVDFNTSVLASEHDLYVMWRPEGRVHEWCAPDADGCYWRTTHEIMIIDNRRSDIALGHLAHEMMHFWNASLLRYRRPGLFSPSFSEIEETHQVPYMFSTWCRDHGKEGQCVEDAVRADIASSLERWCWTSQRCFSTIGAE